MFCGIVKKGSVFLVGTISFLELFEWKVSYAVIPHSRREDLQVVPFNDIVVGLIAWGDHLLVLLVNDLVPLEKLQEFPHGVLVC